MTSRRTRAFGLVEMLAAVAVLAIVVTLTARIFANSSAVLESRGGRVEEDTSGRTAVDMIARDFAGAVADPLLSFSIQTGGLTTYGADTEEARFLSLQDTPSATNRALREIGYWVREMEGPDASNRYELVRGIRAIDPDGPGNPYETNTWQATSGRPELRGVVAQNVACFRLLVPAEDEGQIYEYDSTEPSCSNRLPPYVDVLLEVMSDRSARQVADLVDRGAAYDDLVERRVRRYETRVYFPNRNGYRQR